MAARGPRGSLGVQGAPTPAGALSLRLQPQASPLAAVGPPGAQCLLNVHGLRRVLSPESTWARPGQPRPPPSGSSGPCLAGPRPPSPRPPSTFAPDGPRAALTGPGEGSRLLFRSGHSSPPRSGHPGVRGGPPLCPLSTQGTLTGHCSPARQATRLTLPQPGIVGNCAQGSSIVQMGKPRLRSPGADSCHRGACSRTRPC